MHRYHNNPYYPYSEDKALIVLTEGEKFNNELIKRIKSTKENLFEKIAIVIDDLSTSDDSSIYTGYMGICLLYFMAAVQESNPQLMTSALNLSDKAVGKLKNRRMSFLNGDAGLLAMSAVINNLSGNTPAVFKMIEDLENMAVRVVADRNMASEVLYGQAGFLYALLLVNKHVCHDAIASNTIRQVVTAILRAGMSTAKTSNLGPPLMYEWHDKYYYGAAHGLTGILYILLKARAVMSEREMTNLVRPTLDWLLMQRHTTGNLLSSYGSKTDKLVQWCHGAPGVVSLYTLAYEVFKDPLYMVAAKELCDVAWERGILDKGYSLCHGVAGNAYAFLNLYKATKERIYLYRAACFADWCTKYPSHEGLKPDRPFSLFEGMAGVAYFLIDVLDPLQSCFPGYEL